MATAFNIMGANPNQQTPSLRGSLNLNPSTSAARALQTASGSLNATSGSNALTSSFKLPAATPAPTNQPIKKQTIQTASGDTHTTEYHPPVPTQAGYLSSPQTSSDSQTPPTFGSIVGQQQQAAIPTNTQTSLIGQNLQAAQPNEAQTGIIGSLRNTAAGNESISNRAADIAAQFGQKIGDIGGQGARFEAGQLTTGTSPVAQGNAAVTAQTTAAQQESLARGEEAALQGTAQQLTGQNQEASAYNQAGGLANQQQQNSLAGVNNATNAANTQQQNEITGLDNAAANAKPQLGSIGQVPFSPTTLQQGDVLGTQQPGGVQAAGNLLGQFQGAQTAGAAGGETAAQNIKTSGTSSTTANNAIFQDATKASAGFKTAQNNINTLGNSILQFMSTNPGINNLGARVFNSKLNDLQTQLNDPQYSQFNSQIAGLQRAISQYIQAGEIPTASTAAAKSIADGSINLSALAGALQGINTDLDAAAKAQDTTAAYAQQQMQFGANATSSGGSSSYTSSSGKTYNLPY